MLLLAHTGITLGAAYILEQALRFRPKSRDKNIVIAAPKEPYPAWNKLFSVKVDYRFILLGSILPDLIDKPLGLFVLPGVVENLRTFSHTVLFLFLVILAAFLVYRKQNAAWGFFIAFGVLMHFLLDSMWLEPASLLWPFLGSTFYKYPGMDLDSWLNMRFYDLTAKPEVYIPEAISFIIITFFFIKIVAEKKIRAFFLQGNL